MDTCLKIRSKFLSFFEEKKHLIINSAPLVPFQDKSILFINSGMAPMKQYFLKNEVPPAQNIVNIQKCVRAGGKHNDLDEVGYTPRHHTFFEMCGNFSFGGYSAEVAIKLAFEFLTIVLKLDINRLWVTVHPDDTSTYEIWMKIFPAERIVKLTENIWSMGEDGPCGLCTEIFYDHGAHLEGDLNKGDRFVEIWNIVIMSQELKNGEKVPLNEVCIDTGMGFERLIAILEGTHDNYQAGFFKKAVDIIEYLSGKPISSHHKIIADHARTILFLTAEGIIPGNSGREYVLRRIIRRAALSEFELGVNGLIEEIIRLTSKEMGGVYQEVVDPNLAIQLLKQELEQFNLVCANGLIELNKILINNPKIIEGCALFKLYDTYGLPLDIIRDKARGASLDMLGFNYLMEEAKTRSRQDLSCHRSSYKTNFIGYDCLNNQTKVFDLREDAILLEETVFYPEGGGQKSDEGIIKGANWNFEVRCVKRSEASIWHYGTFLNGQAKIGELCEAIVDVEHRKGCALHHSSTHLLLAALKKLINNNICQKGSLVSENRLRFDFLCPKSLDVKDLENVEHQVNVWIQENHVVSVRYMQKEEAFAMGVVGEFDHKYGDIVRVVQMADSLEFCGGTHVARTGDIGSFYITKKFSISSGIMRIEAIAGMEAYREATENRKTLNALSAKFGKPINTLTQLEINKAAPSKLQITQKELFGIDCVFFISDSPKLVLSSLDKMLSNKNIVIGMSGDSSLFVAAKTRIAELNIMELLIKMDLKVGGRADFAQGGSKNFSHKEFICKFEEILKESCKK